MNHRQWKKAYKKKYGHNPPSKRNSRAIVSKIFEMLGNAFANAAEASKRIAENIKR